jgi:hypothetical protein
LVTFCARVLCAEVDRGSAELGGEDLGSRTDAAAMLRAHLPRAT